jgi:hypothetical protein
MSAARRVQVPVAVAQTLSPGVASTASPVLVTTRLAAEAAGMATSREASDVAKRRNAAQRAVGRFAAMLIVLFTAPLSGQQQTISTGFTRCVENCLYS